MGKSITEESNAYAQTHEGMWRWKKEYNTWKNENILIIRSGLHFLTAVIAVLYGIACEGDGVFLSRGAALLILGAAPLLYYIYYLTFSEVICLVKYPRKADENWIKYHMVPSNWLISILLVGLSNFIYKCRGFASIIDVNKFVGLCMVIFLILFILGIVRTPRYMRTLSHVLELIILLAMICYPLSYSSAFSFCGPAKVEKVKIVDKYREQVKRSGKTKHYLSLEFDDGEIYKKNVELYAYMSTVVGEVLDMEVYDSFLNIRFVDFYSYQRG